MSDRLKERKELLQNAIDSVNAISSGMLSLLATWEELDRVGCSLNDATSGRSYPFAKSLDEQLSQVLVYREALQEKLKGLDNDR